MFNCRSIGIHIGWCFLFTLLIVPVSVYKGDWWFFGLLLYWSLNLFVCVILILLIVKWWALWPVSYWSFFSSIIFWFWCQSIIGWFIFYVLLILSYFINLIKTKPNIWIELNLLFWFLHFPLIIILTFLITKLMYLFSIFSIILIPNCRLTLILKLLKFIHQIYPSTLKIPLLNFILISFFNITLILSIHLRLILQMWFLLHILLTLLYFLLHGSLWNLLRVITKTKLVLI